MSKYLGEFWGTFALVFAGTGAIVVNDISGGALTHLGVSLVFGLVVMVMIYAVGDISGAHLNPAVSAGFWLAGKLSPRELGAFVISQILGALGASLLVKMIFTQHPSLGITQPHHISITGCFIFETVLAFLLMFVIIHVAQGSKEKGLMAGVAVGGTIALEAILAGPVTGASMNPARSLAPAIVSGQFDHLWIYLTAPLAGVALAVWASSAIPRPKS